MKTDKRCELASLTWTDRVLPRIVTRALCVLVLGGVSAACSGGGRIASGSGASPAAASKGGKATSLWGYVFNVNGSNKTPAIRATVWTDPPSDQVFTDSTGYWEIRDGLVDNKYRVLAKSGGTTGRTSAIDVPSGTAVQAEVQIGIEETPWPPTLSAEDKAVPIRKGPKGTRCCGV